MGLPGQFHRICPGLSILIGFGIGYWLSTVFNHSIFIIIGLIVGIIAGFRQVLSHGKKFK